MDGQQPMANPSAGGRERRKLHNAGTDQSGWTLAEGSPSGVGTNRRSLHDAGRDQGGWTVAYGKSISWQ